jgi:MFS family permease
LRSSAFALNILAIHTFGDVISPPIVGWIGDRWNLRLGLLLLAGPIALSGLFWLWGTRHLDRDTELAPTRVLGGPASDAHARATRSTSQHASCGRMPICG